MGELKLKTSEWVMWWMIGGRDADEQKFIIYYPFILVPLLWRIGEEKDAIMLARCVGEEYCTL